MSEEGITDALLPCRFCGGAPDALTFTNEYIQGEMRMWVCQNNERFGGSCPDGNAYLSPEFWNTRQSSLPPVKGTIVEKVARAICVQDTVGMSLDEVTPTEREHYFLLATAAIESMPIQKMVEGLEAADNALRNHACHGGPGVPCARSEMECRLDCGKEAGDALLKVESLLASVRSDGNGV